MILNVTLSSLATLAIGLSMLFNASPVIADEGRQTLGEAIRNGRAQGLTDDEASAIFLYTTNAYLQINKALRERDENPAEYLTWKPQVDLIVSGLSKLPVWKGGSLDRGTKLPKDVADGYLPGKVVSDKAFTSTSTIYGQFRDKHHMIITSRTGREITDLSELTDEQEILFAPDTRFCIMSRRETVLDTEFQMTEWLPEQTDKECEEAALALAAGKK